MLLLKRAQLINKRQEGGHVWTRLWQSLSVTHSKHVNLGTE